MNDKELNVEFEIDSILDEDAKRELSRTSGMERFLMRIGIAKSKKIASLLLLTFALLLLLVSVYIFAQELYFDAPRLTPEELQQIYEITPPSA
ncbi:MAG: hypothetical protein WD003_00825 [Candidatus Paceibacterota bacterium]